MRLSPSPKRPRLGRDQDLPDDEFRHGAGVVAYAAVWHVRPRGYPGGYRRETSPSRGKLVTGATELLRLESLALAGRTFAVAFYFLDGGLVQVVMSSPQYEANERNIALFEDLLKAFRVKFGPERESAIHERPYGLSATAEWTTENLYVAVSPVTQTTSSLGFGFRPSR